MLIEKYIEIKTLKEARDDEMIVASYTKQYRNVSGYKDEPKMKEHEENARLGKCRLPVWRKVKKGGNIVKTSLEEKELMLFGMNEIILHLNNEDAIMPWLMGGVPDMASREEIEDMAHEPKTFAECASLFLRIMKRKSAYEGGLFIDDMVITANSITEKEA